jgi:hypothetical protein
MVGTTSLQEGSRKSNTNRIIAFLEKQNIFNKSKFRFGKNKSTNDAISTIIENIRENLNEKKMQLCTIGFIKSI